jgi:hypothetical protein
MLSIDIIINNVEYKFKESTLYARGTGVIYHTRNTTQLTNEFEPIEYNVESCIQVDDNLVIKTNPNTIKINWKESDEELDLKAFKNKIDLYSILVFSFFFIGLGIYCLLNGCNNIGGACFRYSKIEGQIIDENNYRDKLRYTAIDNNNLTCTFESGDYYRINSYIPLNVDKWNNNLCVESNNLIAIANAGFVFLSFGILIFIVFIFICNNKSFKLHNGNKYNLLENIELTDNL